MGLSRDYLEKISESEKEEVIKQLDEIQSLNTLISENENKLSPLKQKSEKQKKELDESFEKLSSIDEKELPTEYKNQFINFYNLNKEFNKTEKEIKDLETKKEELISSKNDIKIGEKENDFGKLIDIESQKLLNNEVKLDKVEEEDFGTLLDREEKKLTSEDGSNIFKINKENSSLATTEKKVIVPTKEAFEKVSFNRVDDIKNKTNDTIDEIKKSVEQEKNKITETISDDFDIDSFLNDSNNTYEDMNTYLDRLAAESKSKTIN